MSSLRAVEPIDCEISDSFAGCGCPSTDLHAMFVVAAALPFQRRLVFLLLACHCDKPVGNNLHRTCRRVSERSVCVHLANNSFCFAA